MAGKSSSKLGGGTPRADILSFLVMLLATLMPSRLALWERRRGAELGSQVLMADGKRALSEVLVSLSVVAALLATLLGAPGLERGGRSPASPRPS